MDLFSSPRSHLRLAVIMLGVIALASLILYYFRVSISPFLEYAGVIVAAIAFTLSIKQVNYYLFDRNKMNKKERCSFLDKDKCPYPGIDECPYDTDFCSAYPKSFSSKKKKRTWLVLFVIAILCLLFDIFFPETFTFPASGFLRNLLIAFVTASATAYLVDMPNRMKEHQRYYVDLLTSNDYLKSLPESSLLQLREKITWVQRMKDVPNLPVGLVKMDKKISAFLSSPFFRKYTQIVELEKADGETINGEQLVIKKVHIEGTAFNPYPKGKRIRMDLGVSSSMVFDEKQMGDNASIIKHAEELYQLKSFNVVFDDDNKSKNLLDIIDIQIETKTKDGFNYNACLSIVNCRGKDECISQVTPPLEKERKPNYKVAPASSGPVELFVSFDDMISFSMDYVIKVPLSDACFTKRLRYPVKYLHIDYSLGKGLEDYQLVGQVIGTMIDQSEITIFSPESKSRIVVDTRSWLLPKNGAFIVHQKRSGPSASQEEKVNEEAVDDSSEGGVEQIDKTVKPKGEEEKPNNERIEEEDEKKQ